MMKYVLQKYVYVCNLHVCMCVCNFAILAEVNRLLIMYVPCMYIAALVSCSKLSLSYINNLCTCI